VCCELASSSSQATRSLHTLSASARLSSDVILSRREIGSLLLLMVVLASPGPPRAVAVVVAVVAVGGADDAAELSGLCRGVFPAGRQTPVALCWSLAR
jgi:hypothetical protein